MVTTDNDEWANILMRYRLNGLDLDAWQRHAGTGAKYYEVVVPGYKYNMTDLQAALGLHQLARIEKSLERREEIWSNCSTSAWN